MSRLITYNGKTQSLSAWAKEIGVSVCTLASRLNNPNWSLKDSLSIPSHGTRAHPKTPYHAFNPTRWITYNGKTQSLCAWGRETGIYYRTIAARLNAGWSVEEALTKKPLKRIAELEIIPNKDLTEGIKRGYEVFDKSGFLLGKSYQIYTTHWTNSKQINWHKLGYSRTFYTRHESIVDLMVNRPCKVF